MHSITFDRYCIICCGNSDSYPNNRFVLCDHITEPSNYFTRREAFSTAGLSSPQKMIQGFNFIYFLEAVTFAETQGPDNRKCADLFPVYKPGCKFYGNGQNGEGLGACVKDDTSPCPQDGPQWINNEEELCC